MKAQVRVALLWKVLEEGEAGVEEPELADSSSVMWPSGFVEVSPNTAEGVMTALPIQFSWSSKYFEDDWQVLPFPKVELIGDLESPEKSDSQ